jgi:LacI family transcriptional regulator
MPAHGDHAASLTRPRQDDVARLAGVSPTTVSFVLNETRGQTISAETRQRVLTAVAELDYRPNRAAQGLRKGRSETVGFVNHDSEFGTFAAAAIEGAHEASERHGNLLLLVNSGGNARDAAHLIGDLLDRQVDALIFAVSGTRQVTVPERARRVPTILMNCFTRDDDVPAILPDEVRGGREATRVLLELGHREIAYLGGLPAAWASRQRLRGFREALREAGIPASAPTVRAGNFHADSGYELAREVLGQHPRPTAIMCGNDRMAVGALVAILEAGLRVPDDVSLMGYDDQYSLAAEVHPALTTVRLPYHAMGRLAAEHLAARDVRDLPPRTFVHCPVVVRDSVAAPAGTRSDVHRHLPR